jgi:hypothetical protein
MTTINLRRVEDIYPLPPGTTFDRTYFINDEGMIQTLVGDGFAAQSFTGYEVEVADNPLVRRRETFDEFRQRLCIMARGFQRDHGVDAGPVHDLLQGFDCWFEGEAEPGMWVYNSDVLLRPPGDRVLTVGVRTDWDHFGAFAPDWRPLFGGLRSARFARVDGPYPTPTEEDRERIRALKVRVWEAGVRAKSNQSWCGAFERMVGSMRIDANITRVTAPVTQATAAPDGGTPASGLTIGQRTTPDQRHGSPLGSIFRWDGTGGGWNWTVRVDNNHASQNRAGTDYLCGPNTGHYSSGSQDILVHDGSQPMWIEVPTGDAGRTLLEALPLGTHLGTGGREAAMSGNGHLYKHSNGWHASLINTHAAMSTQATLDHGWPLHIMEIPGVPGAEPSQGPGGTVTLDDLL